MEAQEPKVVEEEKSATEKAGTDEQPEPELSFGVRRRARTDAAAGERNGFYKLAPKQHCWQ